MANASIVSFIAGFLVLGFSESFAISNSKIPFSVVPSSALGQKNIDVDLLKIQVVELKKARARASGKKPIIISNLLQKQNKQLIDEMNNFAIHGAPKGISKEQAAQILDLMRSHPVVGHEAARKYDTWDQSIGYCFGRAAFVHWELLRRGVNPESIGKIFLIGDLKLNRRAGNFWNYHMATVVRDRDRSWWVVDSLVDQVLNIEEWAQAMKIWAADPVSPQTRLYFSDAIKMHPIPGAYSSEKLFFSGYKDYFNDLFDWFREHPSQPNESFNDSEFHLPSEGKLEDQIHIFLQDKQFNPTNIS